MDKKQYAYLPEDLLFQMIGQASQTAERLADIIKLNDAQVEMARRALEQKDLIRYCENDGNVDSIMAVDGANIIERKSSADMVLAIAVGVDGLAKSSSESWPKSSRQYQQWQDVLPHHVANPRLTQGVMFLMELSVLAEADRDIRIMDGSHLTTILKLNSLLSAHDDDQADAPYVKALSRFLYQNYERVIPDIPDMIKNAFSEESIISSTKYSSSREIIDSRLQDMDIIADDKVFMSKLLKENEYTKPLPVGQSAKEKDMWSKIHIKCNLPIDDVDLGELGDRLEEAIYPFKISDGHESELYFCYYKPMKNTVVHRLEMKKSLAEDRYRVECLLGNLKKQFVFPEIREPYPQFLADIIAKNIHFGMEAVNQAVMSNESLSTVENFDLILPYRTR